MSPSELELRARFGIPTQARRVLVLCESSHWDTNWLKTSQEYFDSRVDPILKAVLESLETDSRRVYCIESLFFLKLFWERHPTLQPRIRQLFIERRLRLLTAAFTTPDTLLPHSETLLRDFELGHRWLRDNGLPDACSTAYFPDNFGHSPHLPSLMRAVNVNAVGLTRIDGMYFVGADYRRRGHFPRPSSTAALLEQVHRSHDFVWRDDDGAEVLCHWNAHTYFMGDMLAHAGVIRWAGNTFALPWRTRSHIARRIDGYVKKLEAHARTPYLCCPIGMDFNDPIADVGGLIDRYNAERYPDTGTWTVVTGLDDYFSLIDCRRELLPVLDADPNPYWMGFLATRPEVKQRPTRIARLLLLAEKLSAFGARDIALETELNTAWSTLILSNHHDYIPGTSVDRVWDEEQKPWLDAAEVCAHRALQRIAPFPLSGGAAGVEGSVPNGSERDPSSKSDVRPGLRVSTEGSTSPAAPLSLNVHASPRGDDIRIETSAYRLTLSRAHGGCLTSFVTREGECLSGVGFDLVAFHDEGGLWRLGHEFAGGRFSVLERASQRPAKVELTQTPGEVVVRIRSQLQGERFVRTLTCRADEPHVRLRVEGVAAARITVTCRFETALHAETLEMDTLGGIITRPRERLYSPTFWPVPSRLTLRQGRALTALFEAPTAAALGKSGCLEWIVARNAQKERAFRVLPVLAHPIGGSCSDIQIHEAALLAGDDAVELAATQRQLELAWLPEVYRGLFAAAHRLVRCDTAGVSVRAVKRHPEGGRRHGAVVLRARAPSACPTAAEPHGRARGLCVRRAGARARCARHRARRLRRRSPHGPADVGHAARLRRADSSRS